MINKIDYYISYESKVQSGFDVKKVKVDMDKEKKIVKIVWFIFCIIDIWKVFRVS